MSVSKTSESDFLAESLKSTASEITRAEFISARDQSWKQNACGWARSIAQDRFRKQVFDAVESLVDQCLDRIKAGAPTLIDLGCGEGSFLRKCSKDYPGVSCFGLDHCDELLAIANRAPLPDNLHFRSGDFESVHGLGIEKADILVAILSLIECSTLEVTFKNMRRSLKDGGAAIVVVLDPAREIIRALVGENAKQLIEVRSLGGELVFLASSRSGKAPAKLFFPRILYPIERYISAALLSGFHLEQTATVETPGPLNFNPRGIVLFFKAT